MSDSVLPVQRCSDCQFLVKTWRDTSLPTPLVFSLTSEERKCTADPGLTFKAGFALSCHHGVWDQGASLPGSLREIVFETDRRDFCFFFKYRPGMLLPAAKVLQERESSRKEARRERRIAMVGLWIAALAILANVWLTIAGAKTWWPF